MHLKQVLSQQPLVDYDPIPNIEFVPLLLEELLQQTGKGPLNNVIHQDVYVVGM